MRRLRTAWPGFKANINEILGQVSTDVFGNPLCTQYDAAGESAAAPPGQAAGLVSLQRRQRQHLVPNLGPNRYDVDVFPPAARADPDHDPGRFDRLGHLAAGRRAPGWTTSSSSPVNRSRGPGPASCTRRTHLTPAATGGITGRIVSASVWVPFYGGLPYYGGQWGGLNGAKVTGPISDAWIALADLQNGDTRRLCGAGQPRRHLHDQQRPGRQLLLHLLGLQARTTSWTGCR